MSTYLSRWFTRAEMCCKCGCGTYNVADALMERLDLLRDTLNAPLTVRSGCRCVDHNLAVGGKPNSAHVTMIGQPCRAADIECPAGRRMFLFVKAAYTVGFERIFLGPDFVHLDIADDPQHPSPYLGVEWWLAKR